MKGSRLLVAVELGWCVELRWRATPLGPWFTPGRFWRFGHEDQRAAKTPDDHVPRWRMFRTRAEARRVAARTRAGGTFDTRVRRMRVTQELLP